MKSKSKPKSKAQSIMRFKWLANDCKNWDDIIRALKGRIQEVEHLKKIGCKIEQNTNDDYIFYNIPEKSVKEYCKTYKTQEDNLHIFDEEDE